MDAIKSHLQPIFDLAILEEREGVRGRKVTEKALTGSPHTRKGIWKVTIHLPIILYVMCHAPVAYRKYTVYMVFYGRRMVTNVQKVF